jgi:hypothetical protein
LISPCATLSQTRLGILAWFSKTLRRLLNFFFSLRAVGAIFKHHPCCLYRLTPRACRCRSRHRTTQSACFTLRLRLVIMQWRRRWFWLSNRPPSLGIFCRNTNASWWIKGSETVGEQRQRCQTGLRGNMQHLVPNATHRLDGE